MFYNITAFVDCEPVDFSIYVYEDFCFSCFWTSSLLTVLNQIGGNRLENMVQIGTLKTHTKVQKHSVKHFHYFTYNCIARIGMKVKRKENFIFPNYTFS